MSVCCCFHISLFTNFSAATICTLFHPQTSHKHRKRTHSLLGTAEDLAALMHYRSTAAQTVPRLQLVDGISTAFPVADSGAWEEAVRVSGTTVTVMANGSDILSCWKARWERDVWLIERVGLCGNRTSQHCSTAA